MSNNLFECIRKINTELIEIDEEAHLARDKLEATYETNVKLRAEIKELIAENSAKHNEINELKAELERINHDNDTLRQEYQKLLSSIDTAAINRKELTVALAESNYNSLKTEFDKIVADNDRLQEEIERLQGEKEND